MGTPYESYLYLINSWDYRRNQKKDPFYSLQPFDNSVCFTELI